MITVTTAALTFCDYYEAPLHAARRQLETNESPKFPLSHPAHRPDALSGIVAPRQFPRLFLAPAGRHGGSQSGGG